MSSGKGEISQLVDEDGRRPSSNADSFKLHSFYSNLPVFRKKYDWNVPSWTEEELFSLHKFVRSTAVSFLSSEVDAVRPKLSFSENQRVLEIINKLSSRDLYLLYLNFDFPSLSSRLAELVRSEAYEGFLDSLSDSSGVFESFKNLYAPLKPKFQGHDLSLFWDTVANLMNSNRKGALSSKLSTDCCSKFINSTQDGILLTDLTSSDFRTVEEFLSKTTREEALKSSVQNCQLLGVTVYQYLKVLNRQTKTSKWSDAEDSVLLETVSSELDAVEGSSSLGGSFGISWREVSRKIPGKNPEQCRLRYRQIKKKKLSDSPFLSKEMARLRVLEAVYGKNWSKISKFMPGRSSRQCRDKVMESTKYSKENARESLEYFRSFLANFSDYYSTLEKPFFVDRYWRHFDWLGLHLMRVLNVTRNEELLGVLKEFYFSEAIPERIELSFRSKETRVLAQCSGSEICSLSNFVQMMAPHEDEANFEKVMSINKSLVKELFKRCSNGENVDFENFDQTKNFESLKVLVGSLLKSLWP